MVKGKYKDLADIVRISTEAEAVVLVVSTAKMARDSVSTLEAESTNSYPQSYAGLRTTSQAIDS